MHAPTPTFPNPEEHAAAILEALQGDYRKALDYLPVYRDEFGETYARRLAALLTPQPRSPAPSALHRARPPRSAPQAAHTKTFKLFGERIARGSFEPILATPHSHTPWG